MDFDDFNDEQKEVIKSGKGTLLVEAGPGSGKTTVIVSRIEELLNSGVDPESFLVITFTRKAAENLKMKLKWKKINPEIISKMQISTIHSFCLEFLKDRGIDVDLLDDDTSERKALFIQKFKEELGFTGPATVLGNNQLSSIVDKFGEYTCFNVDDEGFLQEIKDTRPVSQEYINFANSMKYFSKKEVKYKELTDDWYNARFSQLVAAYPKYLELLDKYNCVDYDTLQLKTLEELKNDCETKYRTVFVDEFQDTDPLQYEIFKILEKNCDYFTAVGDVDQHIYGFRSSFIDYFKKMEDDDLVDKKISLNCNYRSTDDIVEVTDCFIKDQRGESLKELKSANKKYDNPTFLIENESNEDEAQKIFDIIQHIKESGKIKDYGEVGVLYRTHNNKTITELVNLFNQFNENKYDKDQIKFNIKGQSDLEDQDEIKSILTMLWYITRNTYKGYIPNKYAELEDLNLKAFCGEYFEPKFWSLSSKTKQYLCELQDSFYQSIVDARKEVRKEENRSQNVSSYKIDDNNEKLPTLREIFNRVQMPIIDLSKIDDDNDRRFFEFLDGLREKHNSENPPQIFDTFYALLTYGDYFEDIKNKTPQLKNLAILSQTIYNYSTFISETDLKGLYYFLSGVIRNYTSNYSEDEGVQLMTIHSAKGLEFPVTIVLSLMKGNFPMVSKDPNRERNTRNRRDTFYTPLKYLNYKKFLLDEYPDLSWMEIEDKMDAEEENRVIYVAMTRAADLLILSSVGEVPDEINEIKDKLITYNGLNDLDSVEIHKHFTNQEEEPLKLNFSKFNLYNSCPCAYNLSYNVGFAFPRKEVTDLGSVFHYAMDDVNQKLKINKMIDDKDLEDIIKNAYTSFFDIDENPEQFEKVKKDITDYTKNQACNFDVIDSEYQFSVDMGEYTLNGAVDLIYRISDTEIGILDYKNAESNPHKIRSYSRQLFTYALALKQLDEFKDYDIKEGIIHFVKSKEEPVEITEELIKNQENELNEVALKIKCNNYKKITELKPNDENIFCNYCNFRIFCKNNDEAS